MRFCLRSALFLILGGLASCCAFSASRPAQEPTDYASHFNRGQELLQQMRIHEATAEFREATRLNPEYLPAQQALAISYAATENSVLAWKQVRLLRQSRVDLPKEFLQELRKSLSEVEAVKQMEDLEKKLAAAQKAVVEHPNNPGLLAALGTALDKMGDYPAAQHAADQALLLEPKQPDAHFLLGSMLGGEPYTSEQAIPHLKLYLQNVSRTPETAKEVAQAYNMLASVYGRTGQEAKSLATNEEGLKSAPDDDMMLNNAAWSYAAAQDPSLHDPQKALAYARKAVTISKGENASILDTLAEALYANSLFDEAVAAEKKALALEPKCEICWDQLKKFQAAQQRAQQPKP
ncbi:MAG: tetratricopeptide repeat protein [Candidatus Acidiferrum sp.]